MSISTQIRQQIEKIPREKPFLSSMFLKHGTRAAVDQTLSRLTHAGKIVRITRGIYTRPGKNQYVGEVLPGPFEIARIIAAKTNSVVQVHGAEAARQFGFTTQVSAHPVFYTTGPSRQFKLGKLEINFKHVSSKKLVFSESRVGLAILALWHIGKNQTTLQSIKMIKRKLTEKEFKRFKSSTEHMPYWMVEAISQYEKEKSCG